MNDLDLLSCKWVLVNKRRGLRHLLVPDIRNQRKTHMETK